MDGRVFSALVDIAALTGKAAAAVPVIPPLTAGPSLDDACAKLFEHMDRQSREMTAELTRTTAQLEAMVFEGKIGVHDEIGEG